MTVGFTTNPNHHAHAVPDHPEGPERLDALLRLLEESGLRSRLVEIAPREATDEELSWVHDPGLIEVLDRACREGGGWFDPDTYVRPGSCAAARSAAGACLEATGAVLGGSARSAFCAVRPPGHHARPVQCMGFCLVNNIAVCAEYARRRHGLERIAIVDIDVHHGNGTQDAFYADPGVLYVSAHQYPYYPGTGPASETGAGEARGANVNIPLPAGCGDEEYAQVFEGLVEPVVRRFAPQLLLVSCGFDAHFADPMAGMELSVDGYGDLTSRLRALADDLCEGRLVLALEGGYDFDATAWGARRVIEVLLGVDPTPDPLGHPTHRFAPNVGALIEELRTLHGVGA